MKNVALTRGYTALVDDSDFQALSAFRWFVNVRAKTAYAYRTARRDGRNRNIQMHREILQAPEGVDVDHINRDGLDNRRSNLRFATRSENLRNMATRSGRKTSRFKGVYWRKERCKWTARIVVDGRRVSMGMFSSQEEAALAYDAAALRLFGGRARTNQALGLFQETVKP